MGSKGGSNPSPPAQTSQDRYGPEPGSGPADIDMLALFAAMTEMMQSAPAAPGLPPVPDVYRSPSIDWTEKNKRLAAKAKGDYKADLARQKGRTDTIATSSLLNGVVPDTTESLVTS